MGLYELLDGKHQVTVKLPDPANPNSDTVREFVSKGTKLESEEDLCAKYPGKFRRLHEDGGTSSIGAITAANGWDDAPPDDLYTDLANASALRVKMRSGRVIVYAVVAAAAPHRALCQTVLHNSKAVKLWIEMYLANQEAPAPGVPHSPSDPPRQRPPYTPPEGYVDVTAKYPAATKAGVYVVARGAQLYVMNPDGNGADTPMNQKALKRDNVEAWIEANATLAPV